LLAISGIALSSEFITASATKMDGRCCISSDGGRSYRYRLMMRRAAIPHTCSAYAASLRCDSARGRTDCNSWRESCCRMAFMSALTAAGNSPVQKM
jgi:hypothetical protein